MLETSLARPVPASEPNRRGRLRFGALLIAVLALVSFAATACETRPTLQAGAGGADVVTLQNRLAALHYDIGPVNGVFGEDTRHAVVAFQKVNRLARDGIVGPATWAALDRPYVPRARFNAIITGIPIYGMEVDLNRQVLYLTYRGAAIRILDASTGAGQRGSPYLYTPTGRYGVYRINSVGWEYGSLGALYKPAYFLRGFAVHGSTFVPSYPDSHGCVRLTINARNRLQSSLFPGIPVTIYYG